MEEENPIVMEEENPITPQGHEPVDTPQLEGAGSNSPEVPGAQSRAEPIEGPLTHQPEAVTDASDAEEENLTYEELQAKLQAVQALVERQAHQVRLDRLENLVQLDHLVPVENVEKPVYMSGLDS